jgi:hypothetical protein
MKRRIVVLGAGFGGLELSTILSEALADRLDLTLIDKNEAFFFGFSKLDVMFGRAAPDAVRVAYRSIVKPGVVFRQETVTAIDPEARRVTTNGGTYQADVLIIALGADYDLAATPGLLEGGHEFYSLAGAERLREVLPTFSSGHAIVGVTSAPFKCPPAPSEAAFLHESVANNVCRNVCRSIPINACQYGTWIQVSTNKNNGPAWGPLNSNPAVPTQTASRKGSPFFVALATQTLLAIFAPSVTPSSRTSGGGHVFQRIAGPSVRVVARCMRRRDRHRVPTRDGADTVR